MDSFFNTDTDVYILFYHWHVRYIGGLVGSCLAAFVLAVFHEGIKIGRMHLLRKSVNNVRHRVVETQSEESSLILEQHSEGELPFFSSGHFLQTFLHLVQVLSAYTLMLIVMTYNVCLCISVFLGATFGYFIFGWTRTIDIENKTHV